MEKIKIILKGILLYSTILNIMLFICGIDSILDSGYFVPWILSAIILVIACRKLINPEEFKILTFTKHKE